MLLAVGKQTVEKTLSSILFGRREKFRLKRKKKSSKTLKRGKINLSQLFAVHKTMSPPPLLLLVLVQPLQLHVRAQLDENTLLLFFFFIIILGSRHRRRHVLLVVGEAEPRAESEGKGPTRRSANSGVRGGKLHAPDARPLEARMGAAELGEGLTQMIFND